MKNKLLTLMVVMFMSTVSFATYAAESNVKWYSVVKSCEYRYTDLDGIVTEELHLCKMKDTYQDYPQSESRNSGSQSSRLYDLKLGLVCLNSSNYQVTGPFCRTIQDLRSIDSPGSQEMVRRFDWLVATAKRLDLNVQPALEAFDKNAAAQNRRK